MNSSAVVLAVGAAVLALVLMGWVTRQSLQRYAEPPRDNAPDQPTAFGSDPCATLK